MNILKKLNKTTKKLDFNFKINHKMRPGVGIGIIVYDGDN